jgi:hypothetical protein
MCYAVLYIESGVHFIAAFGAELDGMTPRERAWKFMRECDSLGLAAGFPFEIDTNGNPTGGV